MIVKKRMKRPMTQREMAEKFGVSIATVKNYIALPREEYEGEAKQRRLKAFELRESGMKWKDIGKELNTTINGAVALYKRYKKIEQENRG
ncbi:plasmid replication protein [Salmonella enterica subsp. enterica]|nr:plasmid replication protein [Salmonella enterica subsp. enterica]ECG1608023.1 plasmid replication protein [Salmonella enterica subsp. enterica]ECR5890531.1 plasmid replication protein [Salmonella enterica subsp. enterica]